MSKVEVEVLGSGYVTVCYWFSSSCLILEVIFERNSC